MAQRYRSRVRVLQTLGKDTLAGQFGAVRMNKESASASRHDTIGVRVRLRIRYGIREPVQGQTGIDDTNDLPVTVLQRLAVARHHLIRASRRVIVNVRLRPARLIAQRSHQVPVHIEVFVAVASSLNGTDAVTLMLRISREVKPLFREMVRLKGNRTVIEVRVVQHHVPTEHKHRSRLVCMLLHQPSGHVRGHLHPVQDTLHTQ